MDFWKPLNLGVFAYFGAVAAFVGVLLVYAFAIPALVDAQSTPLLLVAALLGFLAPVALIYFVAAVVVTLRTKSGADKDTPTLH